MEIFNAIILGIIQGITEWLPISSSGHLAIYQTLTGVGSDIFFDVMLHVASLIVLVLFFWREIVKIAGSLFVEKYFRYRPYLLFLIVGSVPVALVGYFFHDLITSFFSSLIAIGIFLLLNGLILYFLARERGKKKMGMIESFSIGIAQAASILPGISRSGSTISAALRNGIEKEEAFRFSFLLAIPAILGAFVVEYEPGGLNAALVVGMVVTVIVGIITLRLLRNIVLRNRLSIFCYYCWLVGILAIVVGMINR